MESYFLGGRGRGKLRKKKDVTAAKLFCCCEHRNLLHVSRGDRGLWLILIKKLNLVPAKSGKPK